MAAFVVLAQFTDQGVRAVKDTTKRAKAFRDLAQQHGVKVRELFWTMGSFDVVLTLEAPNESAVASLMLKAGSLGNLKSQTLRAFSESEMEAILAKV